jgi:hypothetical protein
MTKTRVMLLGLEPSLIDFSQPAYAAFPGMTAERVMSALNADAAKLNALGYDAELCLVDFGETAEQVVRKRLAETPFDCVMIGAGVRLIADNTHLLEKLINAVHAAAPGVKFCFNTRPTDTADAVKRWFPPVR